MNGMVKHNQCRVQWDREEFLEKVLIATLVPLSLNIGKTFHNPEVFERSYDSKIFNSYEILIIFDSAP